MNLIINAGAPGLEDQVWLWAEPGWVPVPGHEGVHLGGGDDAVGEECQHSWTQDHGWACTELVR